MRKSDEETMRALVLSCLHFTTLLIRRRELFSVLWQLLNVLFSGTETRLRCQKIPTPMIARVSRLIQGWDPLEWTYRTLIFWTWSNLLGSQIECFTAIVLVSTIAKWETRKNVAKWCRAFVNHKYFECVCVAALVTEKGPKDKSNLRSGNK